MQPKLKLSVIFQALREVTGFLFKVTVVTPKSMREEKKMGDQKNVVGIGRDERM